MLDSRTLEQPAARAMTFDPKTGTYIRTCKYCEAEMSEPLSEDGKLWMFCCHEHKKRWDQGQRTIAELEKDRTRFL
jgi:hypothetical protein